MTKLEPFRDTDARARFIQMYDAIVSGWPVPCEERDVATAFGSTRVIVCGPDSAPPLVLIHGAATTAAMWGPVIAELSTSYRCYCVDTIIDVNKSVATKRARGVPDYVEWLRQVLSALGVENARVAGFSYGGWLAALLAVHEPALVGRLVLLAPAATLAPITADFLVRMLASRLLRSPVLARRFMQWMSSTPDASSDPVLSLIAVSLVTSRTVGSQMRPPRVLTDDQLRSVTAPTTVLIGDREVVNRGGPQAALA